MIGIGQENHRFAQALRDETLRKQRMAEYARRSKALALAAVIQAAIAFVLFLIPGSHEAPYFFLLAALFFLFLCFRVRHDLRLVKLAEQRAEDERVGG